MSFQTIRNASFASGRLLLPGGAALLATTLIASSVLGWTQYGGAQDDEATPPYLAEAAEPDAAPDTATAQYPPEDADEPAPPEGPAGLDDPVALYDHLRQLRQEEHDYATARALAEQYLTTHPDRAWSRHLVEFEYAMTWYDDDPATAAPLLAAVAAGHRALDPAIEPFLLDDALAYAADSYRRSGDPERAIRTYDAFLETYPASDHRPSALLGLATLHMEQGNPDPALLRWDQLIREFPESDYAPQAQVQIGQIHLASGDYAGAINTFERVPQRWPDSPQVPAALRDANRAMAQLDDAEWVASRSTENAGRRVEVIEATLRRLLTDYPASPSTPAALLDTIEYYQQAYWWMLGDDAAVRRRIIALAEQVRDLYPDTDESWRARLELADALVGPDPARAGALLDEAVQSAVRDNQPDRYVAALYHKGNFCVGTGQPAAARAAFEDVLRSTDSSRVAANTKLCLAHNYAREGNLTAAIKLFDELDSADQPEDIRGVAVLGKAHELYAARERESALAVLDDFLRRFPDSRSAPDALHTRAIWSRPQVLIVPERDPRSAR
jgi:outer membrane protein assembly factor BamD (BamD/ComL family)